MGELPDADGQETYTESDTHETQQMEGVAESELHVRESKIPPRQVAGEESREQGSPSDTPDSEPD
jgi:hypothetical protein